MKFFYSRKTESEHLKKHKNIYLFPYNKNISEYNTGANWSININTVILNTICVVVMVGYMGDPFNTIEYKMLY